MDLVVMDAGSSRGLFAANLKGSILDGATGSEQIRCWPRRGGQPVERHEMRRNRLRAASPQTPFTQPWSWTGLALEFHISSRARPATPQARLSIPQLHHTRAHARAMISPPTTTSNLSDWSIFPQREQLMRKGQKIILLYEDSHGFV